MVSRRDYTKEAVDAARLILQEILHILGDYRDNIVLIGGWVPGVLFNQMENPHPGSIDVDLALDHRKFIDEGYKTIRDLLVSKGYREGRYSYIFLKDIINERGNKITVEVDLLSGEDYGTGKSHRHQRIEDIKALKVRGCDLAFEINEKIELKGELPDGGMDSITIRVAGIVPFLVMKGLALDNRLKEKDAFDIYYCLNVDLDELEALVEKFKPYLKVDMVQEGLRKIKKHFSTVDDIGPKHVADFDLIEDSEERDRIQRVAYEKVKYLMDKLGISDENGRPS